MGSTGVMRQMMRQVLGALLATVVALGVSEAVYHLSPQPDRAGNLRPDAVLGWDSVPAMAPLDNANRPDVVYFIGDSFTQDRRWPSIAQAQARQLGLAVDGYALGVGGFGTTQEWLKIERDFDRHAPKAVVLQFFAWNDFRDNWPYPTIAYSPTASVRPYLVPGPAGYRLARTGPPAALVGWLTATEVWRRWMFRAVLRANDGAAWLAVDRVSSWRLPLSVHYTERSTWEPFYRPDDADRPYVRDAVAATVESFRRLATFLRDRHARLIVVGLDSPFTVDEDVAAAWVRPGMPFDADLPLRRLGDRLRDAGVVFVNVRPALVDAHRRSGRKIYNPPAGDLSGHLEPAGEDVFGAVAARALVDAWRAR